MHNFVTDIIGAFMVIGTVNSATMEINYEDICVYFSLVNRILSYRQMLRVQQ